MNATVRKGERITLAFKNWLGNVVAFHGCYLQ